MLQLLSIVLRTKGNQCHDAEQISDHIGQELAVLSWMQQARRLALPRCWEQPGLAEPIFYPAACFSAAVLSTLFSLCSFAFSVEPKGIFVVSSNI